MLKKALLFIFLLAGSSLAWWDASFPYRMQVNISNGGSALNDYQVTLTLNTQALILAGKMRSDCADLRLVASNDSAQLPYWIESGCNNTQTKIWVKATSIPAGSSILYAYYGNPLAANASNGTNTFEFFDDFEGAGLLAWTNNGGTWSTVGGVRKQTDTSAVVYKNTYINVSIDNYAVHAKFKEPSLSTFAWSGLVTEKDAGAGDSWYGGMPNYADNSKVELLEENLFRYGTALIGFTLQANTWYQMDMLRMPNIQKISLQQVGQPINWQVQTTQTSRTNKIAGFFGGYTHEVWYDDFYVRKYASPEPTTSTLAEEEALQFTYRKGILLNNTGLALSDYQVNLTIDTAALVAAGKLKSDCSDLRFTNSTSYNTQDWLAPYNYWIESGCNTNATKIWVKAPSIPAGMNTIYAYYGNASAANASDGTRTFPFFDDFNTYNTSKWSSDGTPSVSNSTISVSGSSPWPYLKSILTFGTNYSVHWNTNITSTSYAVVGFSTAQTGDTGNNYIAGFYPNYGSAQLIAFNRNGNPGAESYTGIGTYSGYNTYETIRNGSSNTISKINGTQKTTISTNLPSISLPVGLWPQGQTIYADWVFVRKYTSPEPTASFGTEQLSDTTAPAVQIQSPTSITYSTSTVPVNFTATDATGVSCAVRLNGTINSSTCSNYTLTLASGAYVLNVTANDTSGNTNSSQVSFAVAIPVGLQSNTTQATTDTNGIAAGNLSFAFTPGMLKINTGAQEQSKQLRASTGVNKMEIKAKVTLSGQAVSGKQITYTISG